MTDWDSIQWEHRHFVPGRAYRGTLVAVERLDCDSRGTSGATAKFTFDVAGYRLPYLAALPSSHVPMAKCTRLNAALQALGWQQGQRLTTLVGKSAWVTVGSDKSGREIITTISGDVIV